MPWLMASALLLAGLFLGGCSLPPALAARLPLPAAERPAEAHVQALPLAGPLADASAELSGLARYGDQVVLLPQYPARFGGNLFVLSADAIANALRDPAAEPLTPQPLPLDDGGLARSLPASRASRPSPLPATAPISPSRPVLRPTRKATSSWATWPRMAAG